MDHKLLTTKLKGTMKETELLKHSIVSGSSADESNLFQPLEIKKKSA